MKRACGGVNRRGRERGFKGKGVLKAGRGGNENED